MGRCKHCGKSAGLFRKVHEACQQKYDEGWSRMIGTARAAALSGRGVEDLEDRLREIAVRHHVGEGRVRPALVRGWEAAVDGALEDNILTEEEEERLTGFSDRFELSREELDRDGAHERVAKARVLREIVAGDPPTAAVAGFLPFNLQKSEHMVWVFRGVDYFEERTRREYVGGYQGASIRVMKGVYYRVGGFRGRPVDTTETVHVDHGLMGVTTKHIYFAGDRKRFRVRFDKIVSFEPYSDGLGIMRDARTAKLQVFRTGDGWFTYNLVANLARC